jgi:hypothetical protein
MGLSEEDIERLKRMEKRRAKPRYKTSEQLEKEYYEQYPEKAPLKTKLKRAIQDYRYERSKEKEFRKRAYRDAKYEAIYTYEKKRANRRYNPEPPARQPMNQQRPTRQPPMISYQPAHEQKPVDFGGGLLGSLGSVDGASMLGGFGGSSKKKKKYRPPSFDDFLGFK